MNFILWIAILVVLGVVGFIMFDRFRQKSFIENIIVQYSEIVGNSIVDHDKQYIGFLNFKSDTFRVPGLNLLKPIPDLDNFIPTRKGNKKVYLIKLGNERFGFRVPSLNNQVYKQARDENGNLIKINGKPKLIKHKFRYCDDVVEPDVKHWDENIMEKIRQKHRTRADLLSKWIGPIAMTLILVAGIFAIHSVTKYSGEVFDKVSKTADKAVEQAEKNTGLISNLIKRVDGNMNQDSGG